MTTGLLLTKCDKSKIWMITLILNIEFIITICYFVHLASKFVDRYSLFWSLCVALCQISLHYPWKKLVLMNNRTITSKITDISSFLSSNCRLVLSSWAPSKNPKLLRFLGRTSRNTKTDLTPLQAVKGLIWGRWGTLESGSASPAVLWVDFFKIINISIVISINVRNSMISTELAGYSARSNDRGASGKESLDWQEGEQNFWSSFCAFFLIDSVCGTQFCR